MAINKTITDLSTLKINYLTQQMYEDALENDEINENELYITPGSVSTTNWVNGSATNSVRTTGSAAESSSYTMGAGAVAEGSGTKASGSYSHAEGGGTTASGQGSHAEGAGTTASGTQSHAEGAGTTASGTQSHAEGGGTTASGQNSHAEGGYTTASGQNSHAEGGGTMASGVQSHAEGASTIANHRSQHVFGEFNLYDVSTASATERGNYVEIVGNGTSTSNHSNARTLDWSGNEWLAGKLTIGTNPTAAMDVVTKQYMENQGYLTLATLPITDVTVNGTSVVSNGVAAIDLTGKSDTGHTHTTIDITNFPTLATVATSGDYTDLLNKPTVFTGTDGTAAGTNGLVPAPATTDATKYLMANGTWGFAMTGMVIARYGVSTYAEVLDAYQKGWIIYTRASSSSNPASGNQLRMAFLAYVNDMTTPTEFEFQYYRSLSNHTYNDQSDQVFVYKLNKNTGWSVTTRQAVAKIIPSTGLAYTFATGNSPTNTIKVKLNSETSLGTIGTTEGLYPVGVDSNGKLCVLISNE